jgi:hypothetical protein
LEDKISSASIREPRRAPAIAALPRFSAMSATFSVFARSDLVTALIENFALSRT